MVQPTSVVTEVEVIERARKMAACLARRVVEIDSGSGLPDDLVADFVQPGFVKTLVPKAYGGYEFGLTTASAIIQAFAANCPSIAWLLAFYMSYNWLHCQFSQEAQVEVFAHGPSPLMAPLFGPAFKSQSVEEEVLRQWPQPMVSGIPHTNWILSAGLVEGSEHLGPMRFLVPALDIRLINTWQVAVMRATGSWDLVMDDVFIPSADRAGDGSGHGSQSQVECQSQPVLYRAAAHVHVRLRPAGDHRPDVRSSRRDHALQPDRDDGRQGLAA